MRHPWLGASALLLLLPLGATSAEPVVVTPLMATAVTVSGQPIVLPQKDVHLAVSTYDIAAGARLPEHRHPFARYAYVLAGTLEVTNVETGRSETFKAGDFIVEAIGQWHKAVNLGTDAVRLLVIDQTEGAQGNTVLRP
ncbi:MAG: cupin domain-containing protein [Acetobacteraceae bacterium]